MSEQIDSSHPSPGSAPLLIQSRIERLEREQAEQAAQDRQEAKDYKDRQLRLDGRIAKYTLWLAITSLLAFAISAWIAWETRVAAIAAGRAAYLAESSLSLSARTFDETLKEMKGQSTAMADSASAASIANRLARENNQVDHRAWIGPSGANLSHPIQAGQSVPVLIQFENTGRTPAIEFVMTAGASYGSEAAETLTLTPPVLKPSKSLLAPNVTTSIITEEKGILTSQDILNLTPPDARHNAKWRLYVFGIGTYKDIFGKHHVTTFCYVNLPPIPSERVLSPTSGGVIVLDKLKYPCNHMD